MEGIVVLSVLNAKYVHASPAPWCLAAGVQAFAPELTHRVKIVEATINQPLADVLKQIVAFAPAVVGFSCYIWNIKATLELCAVLKKALPNAVIVLGGPEVSYCAKDVLQRNPQIDYILAGEGETSVPAFLQAVFTPGALHELTPQSIPGLCGRHADSTPYESAPCALNGPVPLPFAAGYADAVKGRIAYIETSRGCPYSCAFCLSGQCSSPRFFALDAMFPHLLQLANSGTRTIKFVDRTFNANAAHANQILQFILAHYGKEIPTGVCFHFEIAGDILREETFALLQQMPAGAVQLEIGLQSFYEKTLEAVNRKTNTAILQKNIQRLVAMGNMHIHIDLIAGLPYETLPLFAESFNKGYALGAQMLQLGFLKLLHGSAMRTKPHAFPCEFNDTPPYEVRSTPWLSAGDLEQLRRTENAVDRVYNSGRFRLTAEYAIEASGLTPFAFYSGLGGAAEHANLPWNISLDDYTALLQEYCSSLPGVESEYLRDRLVRDRLATNSTGRLPPCLHRMDAQMTMVLKALSVNPETAPKKGVRRGVAFLYGAKVVCWADYAPADKHPVTGRWPLHEIPMADILP